MGGHDALPKAREIGVQGPGCDVRGYNKTNKRARDDPPPSNSPEKSTREEKSRATEYSAYLEHLFRPAFVPFNAWLYVFFTSGPYISASTK